MTLRSDIPALLKRRDAEAAALCDSEITRLVRAAGGDASEIASGLGADIIEDAGTPDPDEVPKLVAEYAGENLDENRVKHGRLVADPGLRSMLVRVWRAWETQATVVVVAELRRLAPGVSVSDEDAYDVVAQSGSAKFGLDQEELDRAVKNLRAEHGASMADDSPLVADAQARAARDSEWQAWVQRGRRGFAVSASFSVYNAEGDVWTKGGGFSTTHEDKGDDAPMRFKTAREAEVYIAKIATLRGKPGVKAEEMMR